MLLCNCVADFRLPQAGLLTLFNRDAPAAAAASKSCHQLALGSILRESKARELPCGVFGSFGWSGEAVDEMEAKLKDGGYGFAFKPIKVKFKPTATVRLACTAGC
jgi:flavorubredoxin